LLTKEAPADGVEDGGLALTGLSFNEVETGGEGKGLVAVTAKVGQMDVHSFFPRRKVCNDSLLKENLLYLQNE
jgi:hypothetical protein